MKLSKLLLFAVTVIGFQANATLQSPSNFVCPHGDKNALVKNKNRDLGHVNMVMGTGKQQSAPKAPPPQGSKTTT